MKKGSEEGGISGIREREEVEEIQREGAKCPNSKEMY